MSGQGVRTCEIGFTNKEAIETSLTKEEIEAHFNEWEKWFRIYNELPNLFPNALDYLMKEKCITNEALAKKAWLDSRTIQRLRTDVNQKPTLTTVVKICMALELPSMISELMVKKSGNDYRAGTVDVAYRYLLTKCVGYDLVKGNEVIRRFNKTYPLFKQQEKKSKIK